MTAYVHSSLQKELVSFRVTDTCRFICQLSFIFKSFCKYFKLTLRTNKFENSLCLVINKLA